MPKRNVLRCVVLLVAFALQSAVSAPWADACTRVTYLGPDDNVITARSMDLPKEMCRFL